MKCPKKILITFKYKNHQVDVEVPSGEKIGAIKEKIPFMLNMYFKDKSITETVPIGISLYSGDRELDSENIFPNYGIWDGSEIIVR